MLSMSINDAFSFLLPFPSWKGRKALSSFTKPSTARQPHLCTACWYQSQRTRLDQGPGKPFSSLAAWQAPSDPNSPLSRVLCD